MPSIGKAYSDDRDPASEADVSEPDEAAPDAEGIGSQGGMLTAMLTRFPQEISASKPGSPRASFDPPLHRRVRDMWDRV